MSQTSLNVNNWTEGESIEQKLRRIIANNEEIKDNVELNYSDTNAGVGAGYNVKNDKWETAINALDSNGKREALKSVSMGAQAQENMKKEEEGQTTSTSD